MNNSFFPGEYLAGASNHLYSNLFKYETDFFSMPQYQVETEATLYKEYKEAHPKEEEQWCLDQILFAIRKIAGIMTPQYQLPEDARDEARRLGSPIDEDGYFKLARSEMSRIFLLSPSQRGSMPPAGILNEEDEKRIKSAIRAQNNGYLVGKVPNYIEDAFKVVFEITGSAKVRDDRTESDEQKGLILWKGVYIDSPVYIELSYDLASGYARVPLFTAMAYGSAIGDKIIDELRPSDWRKLQEAGISWGNISYGEKQGIFKHSTVDALIQMAGEG
ncbi:hypothetical protein KBC51_00150 [Candidatus Saccharibacteria bacterium]|nr:hypothetical protein [Candidatus Saccharibacteria bacterium]